MFFLGVPLDCGRERFLALHGLSPFELASLPRYDDMEAVKFFQDEMEIAEQSPRCLQDRGCFLHCVLFFLVCCGVVGCRLCSACVSASRSSVSRTWSLWASVVLMCCLIAHLSHMVCVFFILSGSK